MPPACSQIFWYLVIVVHQDVAGVLHVQDLVAGGAGDDVDAGEVLLGPGDFLRLRPSAAGAAGEDDGMEVLDGAIKLERIGEQGKIAVEFAAGADAAPELLGAEKILGFLRFHGEDLPGCVVEIGENAVAIEEELVHVSG